MSCHQGGDPAGHGDRRAEATMTHISDPKEMAKNRVFFTPAVRIDGEMKSVGRVPKVEEIIEWLRVKATA